MCIKIRLRREECIGTEEKKSNMNLAGQTKAGFNNMNININENESAALHNAFTAFVHL